MKFLIPHWHTHHLNEIIHLLENEGHAVFSWESFPRNFHSDPVFRRQFTETVTNQRIDGVFSLQYFPILSHICEQLHIPYLSWCCNDPMNQLLLTGSVTNACNIIFHGDSRWVEKLQRLGVEKVAYLPWAAAAWNTPGTEMTGTQDADLALFDMSSTEDWKLYRNLMAGLDQRTKGFLHGLLQAQQEIYGFSFLEHALNETALKAMEAALPLSAPRNNIAPPEELYARQVLYPAVTRRETDAILRLLADEPGWSASLYTQRTGEFPAPFDRKPLSSADGDAVSKINILPAPRDIQNGIPAQAMDIMGRGGFLLTSFQNDYLRFFEPGKDYVYYESPEDMLDKVRYYLQHEEERQSIARQGHGRVMAEHTLELRIRTLLELSTFI